MVIQREDKHLALLVYQPATRRHQMQALNHDRQTHGTGKPHTSLFYCGIKARSREKLAIISITLNQLQQN